MGEPRACLLPGPSTTGRGAAGVVRVRRNLESCVQVDFSSALHRVCKNWARLEKELKIEAVERARHDAAGDLTAERPTLAKNALRLGVVDDVELLMCPPEVEVGTSFRGAGGRRSMEAALAKILPVKAGCTRITLASVPAAGCGGGQRALL